MTGRRRVFSVWSSVLLPNMSHSLIYQNRHQSSTSCIFFCLSIQMGGKKRELAQLLVTWVCFPPCVSGGINADMFSVSHCVISWISLGAAVCKMFYIPHVISVWLMWPMFFRLCVGFYNILLHYCIGAVLFGYFFYFVALILWLMTQKKNKISWEMY